MSKSIEFYNNDEYQGSIKLQDSVDLDELQDEIWRLLDKCEYLEYEIDKEGE